MASVCNFTLHCDLNHLIQLGHLWSQSVLRIEQKCCRDMLVTGATAALQTVQYKAMYLKFLSLLLVIY